MHRLLFDNNISHRILPRIAKLYPDSTHVMLEELDTSTDDEVWAYAREQHMTIVSKDSDFSDMVLHRGAPPKLIWIKIGNCRVADIEHLLISNHREIKAFIEESNSAILSL